MMVPTRRAWERSIRPGFSVGPISYRLVCSAVPPAFAAKSPLPHADGSRAVRGNDPCGLDFLGGRFHIGWGVTRCSLLAGCLRLSKHPAGGVSPLRRAARTSAHVHPGILQRARPPYAFEARTTPRQARISEAQSPSNGIPTQSMGTI